VGFGFCEKNQGKRSVYRERTIAVGGSGKDGLKRLSLYSSILGEEQEAQHRGRKTYTKGRNENKTCQNIRTLDGHKKQKKIQDTSFEEKGGKYGAWTLSPSSSGS